MKIQDLKFDNHNFNAHTEEGMELLAKSVKENGFGRSVLVDKDGNLIAGNGIVETAIKQGKTKIKVVETEGEELVVVKRTDLDINTEQGRRMALADNVTAHLNLKWNEDELRAAREAWNVEIKDWGIEVEDWGGQNVINQETEKEVKEDEFREEQAKPRCKLGDIWQLGEHRLICGDSTKLKIVEELMQDEKAQMVFTDPPYGYKYNSGWNDKYGNIKNDDKILDFIPSIIPFIEECAIYSFCGWQSVNKWLDYFESTTLKVKNLIVWKKNNHSMGDLKCAYAGQHELCIFLNNGNKEINGKRDTDIWEFDRVAPTLHPTMKPIKLIAYAISKSSKENDIVLDVFGGSGSTLIACEQTKRKARMAELDPHYCDVIIARWENFTKRKAKKIKSA